MSSLRCRWCGLWLLPSRVNDGYPYCNRRCAHASADYRATLPKENAA